MEKFDFKENERVTGEEDESFVTYDLELLSSSGKAARLLKEFIR